MNNVVCLPKENRHSLTKGDQKMSFSVGADIELFAQDQTGKHISLCGKIGGTKEKPLPISTDKSFKGFALQEDNVALEFNIPPALYKEDFLAYIKYMRDTQIPKTLKQLSLVMSKEASVSFDTTELTHPNALIFGCEPDYNAWSKTENKKPTCPNINLRTAGGHVHVGCDKDMLQGIKSMDLFLGVPSIFLDDTPASIERRNLYGKAGAMRPKPYGFEYRVLSNFWMFTDNLINWVYDQTKFAVSFKHKFTKKEEKLIQDCINTGDKKIGETIINTYGITLPLAGI